MASLQHPGCPGCPQQRLWRRILVRRFRSTNHKRRRHGPRAVLIILRDLCIPRNIPSNIPEVRERLTGIPRPEDSRTTRARGPYGTTVDKATSRGIGWCSGGFPGLRLEPVNSRSGRIGSESETPVVESCTEFLNLFRSWWIWRVLYCELFAGRFYCREGVMRTPDKLPPCRPQSLSAEPVRSPGVRKLVNRQPPDKQDCRRHKRAGLRY